MKRLMLITLTLLTISCSEDSDKDGEKKALAGIVPQEIRGEWKGACAGTNFDGKSYSNLQLFVLGPDTAEFMSLRYENSLECKGTANILSRTIYSVTDVAMALSMDSFNLVDLIMEQATMKPATDLETSWFNGSNLCGFNDWQTGVDKSIAGATCNGYKMPNIGSPLYSIYSNDEVSIKIGKNTEGFDGSTPEKRHKEFGGSYAR